MADILAYTFIFCRPFSTEVADVMEAYKYVFSQPGALTAAFNYFRCVFKPRKMEKSTQKIEVPILIIWVK